MGFCGFSWFQVGFRGSWSVFMVFHCSRLVFHGSRSVFMVFHGFRSVFMVPGWVFIFHVENALKMYSDPTIQSRPCLPWTAMAEFTKKVKVFELFLL